MKRFLQQQTIQRAVLMLLLTALAAPWAWATDPHGDLTTRRQPTLIDLGATKCIPCKMMAPILDELDHTYQEHFEVLFYDVWQDNGPARTFKIRMIPTQIFLDAAGKELYRHEGFFSRAEILATWQRLGYNFPALTAHE